jgi:hypothetical protein
MFSTHFWVSSLMSARAREMVIVSPSWMVSGPLPWVVIVTSPASSPCPNTPWPAPSSHFAVKVFSASISVPEFAEPPVGTSTATTTIAASVHAATTAPTQVKWRRRELMNRGRATWVTVIAATVAVAASRPASLNRERLGKSIPSSVSFTHRRDERRE